MLLTPSWEVSTISFLSALRLDVTLVRLGMPPSWMPSTGLIAYSWLRKRLRKCDTLEIQGFTFLKDGSCTHGVLSGKLLQTLPD